MAEISVRASCVNHADRLGVATCDRCQKPVCATCRTDGIHVSGEFCSVECRDAAEAADAERLLQGLDHPFRTGWALWRRSAASLARHVVPVALVITGAFAVVAWLNPIDPLTIPDGEGTVPLPATVTVLAGLVFGVLVVQTVLSKEHTGIVRGNVYTWALRRLVPWGLTWVLMIVATVLGFVALIVPGFIVSLRLFWADEFALAHRCAPVRALRESWQLTRDQAGATFVFQFLAGLVAWPVVVVGVLVFALLQAVLLPLGALGSYLRTALGLTLLFVGYGVMHAPEVAKFYGMRAAKSRGVHPGERAPASA